LAALDALCDLAERRLITTPIAATRSFDELHSVLGSLVGGSTPGKLVVLPRS
jgi:hypothetical protein